MEIDKGSRGPSKLLKGCAIVGILAIVGLIVLLMYLMKMPSVKFIRECRMNMAAVGEAIGRYHDSTGDYPQDLRAIEKEYLADRSVLRCPLDKSKGDEPSYTYHRPGAKAGEKFVMMECNRHRLSKDMPVSKLVLYRNGIVEMEKPDMKKVMDEQDKKK